MDWLLLVLLGLAAGTFGSLLGLGGGIIVVPALLVMSDVVPSFAGITPQTAVGTSLLIMIFTGMSSTISYTKQKVVDMKSGFIFLAGSGPGALFGVWLNKGMETNVFLIIFGLFMLFVAFVLFIRNRLKPLPVKRTSIKREYITELGEKQEYGFSLALGLSIAFAVGTLSGLFGIGGGSLMVPAMILLFGFPPHVAVATSMFMILFSSIISSISHISLGNVEWLYALALIPGAWFGASIGAAINKRLKSNTLIILLRFFLIIIAFRLIWQGIQGI
ncbi:hypothetical protein ATL39_3309 [Sinobaca qinghaiensis]|uniref:Probable membrane transporter protein n=1 Tax=Sinobaca qinghaiensis TaxID=342944 RepID=A0A419UWA0_9BACL|nr:sulfite exporter TauE/SafE family protein [Sinobaca qinghaiensis]RKD68846.1 hypothetical protein ATL39_3309 [Sinobaca qinghaiensis]